MDNMQVFKIVSALKRILKLFSAFKNTMTYRFVDCEW